MHLSKKEEQLGDLVKVKTMADVKQTASLYCEEMKDCETFSI